MAGRPCRSLWQPDCLRPGRYPRRCVTAVALLDLTWLAVQGFAVLDMGPCLSPEPASGCEAAISALDAAFRFSGMALVLGLEAVVAGGRQQLDEREHELRDASMQVLQHTGSDSEILAELMAQANQPSWSMEDQMTSGCLAVWLAGAAMEGDACHANDTAHILELEGLSEVVHTLPAGRGSMSVHCQELGRGVSTTHWPPELVASLQRLRRAVLADFEALLPVREALVALAEAALSLPSGELRKRVQVRDVGGYRVHHYSAPGQGTQDPKTSTAEERRYYHPHIDAGTLRLIRQDPQSPRGLQVEVEGGRWLDVPYLEGSMLLLVGDTFERVTNGRWRASRHRVFGGASPERSRTTLRASVFHFKPDESLDCLEGCCQRRNFAYPVISARELMQHFRDNGAMTKPRGLLF